MNTATQKKRKPQAEGSATPEAGHHDLPKKGDRLRCDECGMEVQVTADCNCEEADHVHFECCGHEMHKA